MESRKIGLMNLFAGQHWRCSQGTDLWTQWGKEKEGYIEKVTLGHIHSIQSLSCVRLFASHEPQHTRPPCPAPTPGVHPNPCPLSW